jgi:hypothetical protein
VASTDLRTRPDVESVLVDLDTFVRDDLHELVDRNGQEAGRSAAALGLGPLTLQVDDDAVTLVPEEGRLTLMAAGGAGVTVTVDRDGFTDLVRDSASTFGLQMTGRAQIVEGTVDDFVAWEPVLRTLLDGRPVYEPGSISFHGPAGGAIDLHRSFTLDDDPEEIGHFLAEAGYLHLAGVFTDDEMAAVAADLDAAAAKAERDDGASWWARTDRDEWFPARILGFNQQSPALRALLHDDRYRRIGTFTDDDYEPRDPDVGDSAEGLQKKVGVVEGISDVSWHKDCAMGGHSRHCCGLVVGVSVTGAGPDSGELGAVAGSHRANVPPLGIEGIDLPRIALPTATGDVTVHCSCTLHMSRPPVSTERKVVYTGFGLVPRDGDTRKAQSHDDVRRARASLNDHVRNQQRSDVMSTASFEL